jgi:hypothetical protein
VPRFDPSRAAPEPLRLVQRIVNIVDREHGYEWLGSAQDLAALLGCDRPDSWCSMQLCGSSVKTRSYRSVEARR